jgi:6-phosphogluconolactonase
MAAPVNEGAMARGAVIRLADTPEAMAQAAASEVLAVVEAAMAWRGECHVALAGGRTPASLYRALATRPFEGWSHVHAWFGDERAVGPDHPDSNYRMAKDTLLSAVGIPESQVHRWEGELPPAAAAARYDMALRGLAARQDRPAPTFDLLLLGLGADAHTASLFPGSPLLTASADQPVEAFAAAVHVPAMHAWRLTLTPATIRAARIAFVLVTGEDKHAALRRVLGQPSQLADVPAALLHELHGDVAWYVDRAALFGAQTAPSPPA